MADRDDLERLRSRDPVLALPPAPAVGAPAVLGRIRARADGKALAPGTFALLDRATIGGAEVEGGAATFKFAPSGSKPLAALIRRDPPRPGSMVVADFTDHRWVVRPPYSIAVAGHTLTVVIGQTCPINQPPGGMSVQATIYSDPQGQVVAAGPFTTNAAGSATVTLSYGTYYLKAAAPPVACLGPVPLTKFTFSAQTPVAVFLHPIVLKDDFVPMVGLTDGYLPTTLHWFDGYGTVALTAEAYPGPTGSFLCAGNPYSGRWIGTFSRPVPKNLFTIDTADGNSSCHQDTGATGTSMVQFTAVLSTQCFSPNWGIYVTGPQFCFGGLRYLYLSAVPYSDSPPDPACNLVYQGNATLDPNAGAFLLGFNNTAEYCTPDGNSGIGHRPQDGPPGTKCLGTPCAPYGGPNPSAVTE